MQQIIVTCNYEARRRGVGKLQLLSEALRVCPDLVLVDGSDIGRYRRMSNKIHRLVNLLINGAAVADSDPLEPSSPPPVATVERMGLDELFVDVTELVRRHLDSDEATIWPDGTCVFRLPGMLDAARESQRDGSQSNVAASAGFAYSPKDWCGHILGSECDAALDPAHLLLLRTASHVCGEVRAAIYNNFDLTCSGGIARCKLLAKLAAAQNKPNMQTVFLDSPQSLAVFDSTDIRKIPGIGLAHPNLDFDGDLSDEVESTVEDEDVVFTEPFNPPVSQHTQEANQLEQQQARMQAWAFSHTMAQIRTLVPEQRWLALFGGRVGARCWELVNAVDNAPVVHSPWPRQISVEDSFLKCSNLADARRRLLDLARSLIERYDEEELVTPTQTSLRSGSISRRRSRIAFRDASRRNNAEDVPATERETSPPLVEDCVEPKDSAAIEMQAPVSFDDADRAAQMSQRVFRRYAGAVRFSARFKTHDYQSKTNGRESKTVSVPVDVFDLDLAIKERARLLTDKCFMPALRTLLGLAYVSDPGRPFHATLFNIAFVELARSPPQHSISAFFKGQVTKKIFCGGIAETAADHDAPIPALSETLDMEVFEALPEDLRREIIEHHHRLYEPDERRRVAPTSTPARSRGTPVSKAGSVGKKARAARTTGSSAATVEAAVRTKTLDSWFKRQV
ncbi:hypothetical protein HK105_206567 [Polyrhizophydium stewartii]|uniref:UmuC domain-containing protein n=1 Tax=Polyrhizophydium stewartii TaxID=2732419 RepID=A0ABR4N360_9FUNG